MTMSVSSLSFMARFSRDHIELCTAQLFRNAAGLSRYYDRAVH